MAHRVIRHPAVVVLAALAVAAVIAGCGSSGDVDLTAPDGRDVSHAGVTVTLPAGWVASTADPLRLVLATTEDDLLAQAPDGPRIVAHGSSVLGVPVGPPEPVLDEDTTWTWRGRGVEETTVPAGSAAILDYDLVGDEVTWHHRTAVVTGDAGASALLDLEATAPGMGFDELAAVLDTVVIDPPSTSSPSTPETPTSTATTAPSPVATEQGRAMAADLIGAYGFSVDAFPATETDCLAVGFDRMPAGQRAELDSGDALTAETATALEQMVDGCLSAETGRRLLAAAFSDSAGTPEQAACVAGELATTWTFGKALAVAMQDTDTAALVADLTDALETCGR